MTETDLENTEEERNWRQDKLLTIDEIERLQKGGENIHLLKGKRHASKRDIYKDTEGNIYVQPKGGMGTGEFTDLNINDF